MNYKLSLSFRILILLVNTVHPQTYIILKVYIKSRKEIKLHLLIEGIAPTEKEKKNKIENYKSIQIILFLLSPLMILYM
jgi:hypothetical protein